MALGADGITLTSQLPGMVIVAIGAAQATVIHPGLKEGAIDINLVINLPISMIKTINQQCRKEIIVVAFTSLLILTNLAAATVTYRAGFNLTLGLTRYRPYWQT